MSGIEVEELSIRTSSDNPKSVDDDWMTAIFREKAFQ